ncbi:hypothetical protein SCUP515_12751 [Seiridium cupressi]
MEFKVQSEQFLSQMAPLETRIITDVNYWPDLAKYITAWRPAVRPVHYTVEIQPIHVSIKCTICHTKHLRLPPWIQHPTLAAAETPTEPLCVIPGCGHVVGYVCMENWLSHCEETGMEPSCPFCRFVLRYPGCQHNIPVSPVPELSPDQRVEDFVPRTPIWGFLQKDNHDEEDDGGTDGKGGESWHLRELPGIHGMEYWSKLSEPKTRVGQLCRPCKRTHVKKLAKEVIDVGLDVQGLWGADGEPLFSCSDMKGDLTFGNIQFASRVWRFANDTLQMFDEYQERANVW